MPAEDLSEFPLGPRLRCEWPELDDGPALVAVERALESHPGEIPGTPAHLVVVAHDAWFTGSPTPRSRMIPARSRRVRPPRVNRW